MECELFQDMRGQRLLLRSVKLEEPLVTDFMDKAMEIFKLNTVGPQKYLNTYKKYADLLNNKAEQEVTAFLKERHSLQGFKAVSRLFSYWKEIWTVILLFKLIVFEVAATAHLLSCWIVCHDEELIKVIS